MNDILATAVKAVQLYAETHPRPSLVNLKQACEILNLSHPTVRKLIRHGSIKQTEIGMIPITEIDRYLDIRQRAT